MAIPPFFQANISPEWWSRHLFCAFINFEWVLSQFCDLAIFWLCLGHFSSLTAKKLKVPRHCVQCTFKSHH